MVTRVESHIEEVGEGGVRVEDLSELLRKVGSGCFYGSCCLYGGCCWCMVVVVGAWWLLMLHGGC